MAHIVLVKDSLLPTVELVAPCSFAAPKGSADQPEQCEDDRGNPKNVECEPQSGQEQNYEKYKQ
jgi:hypothetical protein